MTQHKPTSQADDGSGRFAYDQLSRSIHEKARLGIMTSLITQPDGVSFNELKTLCDLTDGNLSRHLNVLVEDGLIRIEKGHDGTRPKTVCYLTELGRCRFVDYLQELQRVIADASQAAGITPAAKLRLGIAPN